MNEYDFDLVIVGAGPAGSSAAFAASSEGVSVALLEKEEAVAETVRTSGVTWIEDAKEFGTVSYTHLTLPTKRIV